MEYNEHWVQNSHMQHNPSFSKTEPLDDGSFPCNRIRMEKNVIPRINAAEEIRMCVQSYSKHNDELNKGFKVALQNFGEKKTTMDTTSIFSKNFKVVQKETIQGQVKTSKENKNKHELHSARRDTPLTPEIHRIPSKNNQTTEEHSDSENKVVLREKKPKQKNINLAAEFIL